MTDSSQIMSARMFLGLDKAQSCSKVKIWIFWFNEMSVDFSNILSKWYKCMLILSCGTPFGSPQFMLSVRGLVGIVFGILYSLSSKRGHGWLVKTSM